MKVKIEKSVYGHKIVFDINSKEDAIEFHDRVAIKITKGKHEFIGDCCFLINGQEFENKEYDI